MGQVVFPILLSPSSSATSAPSCVAPANAQIRGLPAVACGEEFDRALDEPLGYYTFEEAEFASNFAKIAPGIELDLDTWGDDGKFKPSGKENKKFTAAEKKIVKMKEAGKLTTR